MHIIYFDSNIYHDLLRAPSARQEIEAAIADKDVRVFLSECNLVELAAGYAANPSGAAAAFALTQQLCMRRPTRPIWDLFQREVRRLKDPSVNIGVHLPPDSREAIQFLAGWDALVRGEQPLQIAATAREIQEDLKQLYAGAQAKSHERADEAMIIEWTGRLPDGHIPSAYFWSNPECIKHWLKPSLQSYVTGSRLETTVEELWPDLLRCPSLVAQFSYYMQLFLHERVRRRQVRESDAYDIKHVAYASYANIFVSNDRFLRNGMRAAGFREGTVMSLEEFKAALMPAD